MRPLSLQLDHDMSLIAFRKDLGLLSCFDFYIDLMFPAFIKTFKIDIFIEDLFFFFVAVLWM